MTLHWEAIASSLYFGAFWALLGGLLIFTMHLRPWKSALLSIAAWFASALLAAALTWTITGTLDAVIAPLILSMLLGAAAPVAIPHLTSFGCGMLAQRLYLPLWGMASLYHYLVDANWPIYAWIGYAGLAGLTASTLFVKQYYVWSPLAEFIRRYPRRDRALANIEALRGRVSPKVSIHLPCYSEPPELVIATLDSIARMRYSNFEVLVIDNNTKDARLWKPVEAHCRKLGERFRFFHVDQLSGAKAGALNFALQHIATDAELVAVIDADYIAEPDFLEKYAPLFQDPQTGFVQTSHDYRECEGSLFLTGAYYEYVPVHKLTFPSLSEHDASFTVGTMCLVRHEALGKAGGWAEWSLTEDSEVAVRIHALGYTGYTLKDTAGRGLIPDTMEGMKKQQFRWTAGPVQQLQKHWRLYFGLGGNGRLNFSQKAIEIQHSFARLGSVAGLLAAIPTLAACLYAILNDVLIPVGQPVLVLIAAVAITTALEGWITVRLCGGRQFRNYLYGLLIRNALQWTYICGFVAPLFKLNIAWHKTDKFEQSSSFGRALLASKTETLVALAYFAAAAVLIHFGSLKPLDWLALTGFLFATQGLQFMCTLVMALVSEYELYAKTRNRAAAEPVSVPTAWTTGLASADRPELAP